MVDRLLDLLNAGQKFLLEATDEEILAEAEAAGEDINESAERFRHMVAAARKRVDE